MRRRALLPILGMAALGLGIAAATVSEECGSPPAESLADDEERAVLRVALEEGAGARGGRLGAEVLGVDLPRGAAVVFLDGEERLVRGTPGQLRGLAPGDAIDLRFRIYGSETWLWPPTTGDVASRFGTWGTLTGPVEGIDPFGGALRVGGQQLRAHPEHVASLLPGERISLCFARVGDVSWALSLERDELSAASPAAAGRERSLRCVDK